MIRKFFWLATLAVVLLSATPLRKTKVALIPFKGVDTSYARLLKKEI